LLESLDKIRLPAGHKTWFRRQAAPLLILDVQGSPIGHNRSLMAKPSSLRKFG
jgi:hypothetical protein